MTHQEAIEKLEIDIQLRGMSPHTVKEYRDRVRKFLQHFKDKSIEELCETDFRIYLEYLDREANIQPATINNYNSALRFFFEVTLEQTLCYRRLPRKKDPIKLPVAFTRQEILWLLDAIDDSTRHKAIFSLTYGCGLRLSEVRHLRVKDIDSEQMRLFVYQGKGQRDRWIPLSQFALEDLRAYFREYSPNHPEGYLFYTKRGKEHQMTWRAIQDAFGKYRKRANLSDDFTVHTLRHAYVKLLLKCFFKLLIKSNLNVLVEVGFIY